MILLIPASATLRASTLTRVSGRPLLRANEPEESAGSPAPTIASSPLSTRSPGPERLPRSQIRVLKVSFAP